MIFCPTPSGFTVSEASNSFHRYSRAAGSTLVTRITHLHGLGNRKSQVGANGRRSFSTVSKIFAPRWLRWNNHLVPRCVNWRISREPQQGGHAPLVVGE